MLETKQQKGLVTHPAHQYCDQAINYIGDICKVVNLLPLVPAHRDRPGAGHLTASQCWPPPVVLEERHNKLADMIHPLQLPDQAVILVSSWQLRN